MNTDQLIKKSKSQGLDTLARIGGATVGKVATAFLKMNGLVPSLVLLIGGFAIAIQAPDKYKLKEMGEGLALYGGMNFLGELTKDQITLVNSVGGLAGTFDKSLANPIPSAVRSIISKYLPTLNGADFQIYQLQPGQANRYAMLNGADTQNLLRQLHPASPLPVYGANGVGNLKSQNEPVSMVY